MKKCVSLILVCILFTRIAHSSPIIKLGLLARTSKDQVNAETAVKWAKSRWSDVNYELKIFYVEEALRNVHEFGKNISESGVHLFIEPHPKINKLSCIVHRQNQPIITEAQPRWCKQSNTFVSVSTSPGFKAEITNNLLQLNKWKEVAVLFEDDKEADLEAFLWRLSVSIRVHTVRMSFDGSGNVWNASKRELKNVLARTEGVEVTILILKETNIKLFFRLLETELAEVKGFLSSYLFYEPDIKKTMEVSGDYTIIGFQFPVQESYADTEDVFLHDAFAVAFGLAKQHVAQKTCGFSSPVNCVNDMTTFLTTLLAKVNIDGASGKIQFESGGIRKGVHLDIINLQNNKFIKVGHANANGTVTLTAKVIRNFEQAMFTIRKPRPIIVSMIRSTPFIIDEKVNGTVRHYGLLIEILDEIARMADFKYTLQLVGDLEYGREKNGRWTGMIGDVLYQRADMALAALTVTSLREKVVDFIPFMELDIVYTKKRDEVQKRALLEFLEPFSVGVWMICLTLVVCVGLIIFSYERLESANTERGSYLRGNDEMTISASIWFIVTSILQQSSDERPTSFAGRILTGFFWFMVLIFIATYTANLAAFFTSRRLQTDVTELEEFLKLNYTFSVVQHSALHQIFKSSENDIYQMINDKMTRENSFVTGSIDGVGKTRSVKNFIYIGEEPFVRKRTAPPCETYLVKGIMPPKSFGIPVRKNSPLRQPLSIAVSKLIESGFIQRRLHYWFDVNNVDKYCTNVYKRRLDNEWSSEQIDILHFWGVSLSLGIGALLAVVFLFIEHYWNNKLKEKVQHFQESLRRSRFASMGLHSNKQNMSRRKELEGITFKEFEWRNEAEQRRIMTASSHARGNIQSNEIHHVLVH